MQKRFEAAKVAWRFGGKVWGVRDSETGREFGVHGTTKKEAEKQAESLNEGKGEFLLLRILTGGE